MYTLHCVYIGRILSQSDLHTCWYTAADRLCCWQSHPNSSWIRFSR